MSGPPCPVPSTSFTVLDRGMIATMNSWLLTIPIWLMGLALFLGMLAAASVGSWLRRKHEAARADRGEDKEDDKEGLVVSSVMGLLALLIGFTFSLALDRFDARRGAVVDDANTIGTTYLQTQLLDSPHRERISQLLMAYANNRLILAKAAPGAQTKSALAVNDRLITELWTEMVAAFPSIKGYDFSSTYVSSMNALIDMDAARKAARRASVPGEVFLLLFVYQLVAAGVVGHRLTGRRGRQGAAFLFFLFGLSVMVVIDLNRAVTGWVRVPQQAITDLIEFMDANPPSRFQAGPSPEAVAR